MKLRSAERKESKNLTFTRNCNPRLGPLENCGGQGWKLTLQSKKCYELFPGLGVDIIKYNISDK